MRRIIRYIVVYGGIIVLSVAFAAIIGWTAQGGKW